MYLWQVCCSRYPGSRASTLVGEPVLDDHLLEFSDIVLAYELPYVELV